MKSSDIRNLLLSDDFKPKEQDLPTPYLVAKSGVSLDGEIKLVGLSGKESVEIREKAKVQVGVDKDGNPIMDQDSAKLAGLAIIACLYSREDNQPIFDQTMPMLGDPADLAGILGVDEGPWNLLGVDVLTFAGFSKKAADTAKNASSPTLNTSSSGISPTDSVGSDPSVSSSDSSQATNSPQE
jgi:hypothetical protein